MDNTPFDPATPKRQQDGRLVPSTSKTPANRYQRVVQYWRVAQAVAPRVVGPMPAKRFIGRYLKYPNALPSHLEAISFDSVLAKSKREMCVKLLPSLNKIVEPTGFTFGTTPNTVNDHRGGAYAAKPDIVLTRKEDPVLLLNRRQHVKENTTRGRQSTPKGSGRADAERLVEGADIHGAHLGRVQLFIEANDSPDDDFFTDPVELEITNPSLFHSDGDGEEGDSEGEGGEASKEDDNESEGDEREYWGDGLHGWGRRHQDDDGGGGEGRGTRRARWFIAVPTLGIDDDRVIAFGQIASYAEELLTRQFRTCVFSLSMSGRFVRFLRWDREGVTVSEAVDYKSNPSLLATFLWAFTSTLDSGRGWDITAQPSLDPNNEVLFNNKVTRHVMHQLNMKGDHKDLAKKVGEHHEKGVITKLFVPSAELEGESLQVLVSRPCFVSNSPTGRSTRGYWGVVVKKSPEESEVVFVKDTWRSNAEGVECEGDILRSLCEKGVRNIPPLVAHGDVKVNGVVQVTGTDQLVRESWVASLTAEEIKRMNSHTHYRLVTRKAGYPLETFTGSMELLKGTYGAFQAVVDAHDKANALHQDMSLDNIILYRDEDGTPRAGYLINWEHKRNVDDTPVDIFNLPGTPAFMSFDPARTRHYIYKLKDDLEAFIYIILYCALQWLPVTSDYSLKWWLNNFFTIGPTPWSGGLLYKECNACDRTFTKGLKSKTSTKVLEWLNVAMDLHYNVVPNPLWDNGKALGNMWRETLKEDVPDQDRRPHSVGSRDTQPLGATIPTQPPIELHEDGQHNLRQPTSAKHPWPFSEGCIEDSPSKRPKSNRKVI